MGWIGDKWGELTGQNQQVDPNQINSEYDTAFGTYDQGTGVGTGAMGTYGQLQQRGLDMMDPDSQFNLTQKAGIQSSAADSAAEASRLAGRNAAQAGGAPAAALAAQTYNKSNQAQAGAQGAYNKYLQGAMSQGVGMASGAANNMAQMKQTKMNAFSNQRLANSQIDSQATGFGAQMLGKGLGALFNPTGIAGQQEGGYIGMQDGGSVDMYQSGGYADSPYGNRGGMLSQIMGPDGLPMNIKTRIGGQTVGQ
tara:strand:+ start:1219 stop:1974 length:756 start_codon:yes stop_codon:yes gene_type:complete